jgi:hypothetical protein
MLFLCDDESKTFSIDRNIKEEEKKFKLLSLR